MLPDEGTKSAEGTKSDEGTRFDEGTKFGEGTKFSIMGRMARTYVRCRIGPMFAPEGIAPMFDRFGADMGFDSMFDPEPMFVPAPMFVPDPMFAPLPCSPRSLLS